MGNHTLILIITLLSIAQCNKVLQVLDLNLNSYQISTKFCSITKKSGGLIVQTLWSINYDESGTGCRGVDIELNLSFGELYAVFEINGPSTQKSYFSNNEKTNAPSAFRNALFTNYGLGSNSYVSIIVRVDLETGKLIYGTFLMSRWNGGQLGNEKSYPFSIKRINNKKEGVVVVGYSDAKPPSEESKQNNFQVMEDFEDDDFVQITFKKSLDGIIEIEQGWLRTLEVNQDENILAMFTQAQSSHIITAIFIVLVAIQ